MSETTAMTRETFMSMMGDVMLRPIFVDETGQAQAGNAVAAAAVWEDITEGRWATEIPADATTDRIKEIFADCCSDCINVLTDDEFRAHNDRKEREELESYVALVARRAKIDPKDTSAVLDALQCALDDAQADLEGAWEDRLCIGFGATVESLNDHCDGIRERGNEAQRAIDYLAKNAPLAYAVWAEKS